MRKLIVTVAIAAIHTSSGELSVSQSYKDPLLSPEDGGVMGTYSGAKIHSYSGKSDHLVVGGRWTGGSPITLHTRNGFTDDWSTSEIGVAETVGGLPFGRSFAMTEDPVITVVVGAGIGSGSSGQGKLFTYRQNSNGTFNTSSIVSPNSTPQDNFGCDIAITTRVVPDPLEPGTNIFENWLFVGESGNAGSGSQAGALHVYREINSSWIHVAEITPASSAAGDKFGSQLAMCGDQLFISAPGYNHNGVSNSGAIYVFDFDDLNASSGSWVHSAQLVPNVPLANGSLGSISLECSSGMVVSRYGTSSNRTIALFERQSDDTWSETMLMPDDPAATGASFGARLALNSGMLVATEPGWDPVGIQGRIHFYERVLGDAWSFSRSVDNPNTGAKIAGNDGFGSSVALLESQVLVGSQGRDDDGQDSGGVVFLNVEALDPKNYDSGYINAFTPEDPSSDKGFGRSIATRGTYSKGRVVVGSSLPYGVISIVWDDQNKQWLQSKVVPGPGLSEFFGGGLLAFNRESFLFVGSNSAYPSSPGSGKLHIFEKDSSHSWAENWTLTAPQPEIGARFGYDMESFEDGEDLVDGQNDTWLAISAPYSSAGGKVIMFHQEIDFDFNYGQPLATQTIMPPSGGGSLFGHSLAKFGEKLLIAEPQPGISSNGKIHEYELDTQSGQWLHVGSLESTILAGSFDLLGKIALEASDTAIAAVAEIQGGRKVVVFTLGDDGAMAEQVISSPTVETGRFGNSVAFHKDLLLISDPSFDEGGEQGVVYAYRQIDGIWNKSFTLENPVPSSRSASSNVEDRFGWDLAVGGDELIVSAPWSIGGGVDRAGVLYHFELSSGFESAVAATTYARLTDPNNTIDLWSDYSTRLWNSDAWAAAYDFSGMSWNNEFVGTLITPEHVISATHKGIPGKGNLIAPSTLIFTDHNGVDHVRSVIDSVNGIGEDVRISRLNQPLPPSIKVYKLPKADDVYYRNLSNAGSRSAPIAITTAWNRPGPDRRLHIPTKISVGVNGDSKSIGADTELYLPLGVLDEFYSYSTQNGDSSFPHFLPTQSGDLVLFFVNYFANAGDNLANREIQWEIEKAIIELGASNPLNLAPSYQEPITGGASNF